LIASNPPYVAAGDPHLADADLRCEPANALVAGSDGLDALRTIIAGAPARLVRGGCLAVEHGYDQADAVRDLFGAAGLVDLVSARDLAGIPRVVAGRVR
jgi:release factor glutamine methyltransferase